MRKCIFWVKKGFFVLLLNACDCRDDKTLIVNESGTEMFTVGRYGNDKWKFSFFRFSSS